MENSLENLNFLFDVLRFCINYEQLDGSENFKGHLKSSVKAPKKLIKNKTPGDSI
jgi:hypothetical protein